MTHYTVTLYRGGHLIGTLPFPSLLQATRYANRKVRKGRKGWLAEVKMVADLSTHYHDRGQPGGIVKRVRNAPR